MNASIATGAPAPRICLIGHPYAPIGMGEHLRCGYRAMRSVALQPYLMDIYGLVKPDADSLAELSPALTNRPGDVNVFHINGDEVAQALSHLSPVGDWPGRRIIYPMWELARYPEEWARQLDRFDEIWAPSRYVQAALEAACARPVVHMPLACEIQLSSFLSRRYFGIPEPVYAFLFFFDTRSYVTRKNPAGVIEAFRRLVVLQPAAPVHLVLKMNGAGPLQEVEDDLRRQLEDLGSRVTLINRQMTNNEVKNLIRCCDSFVSLHRSEGFGLGIAEAMLLGKPVIATAYSGNMDFMREDVSLGVDYKLIPLSEGDYPHYQGQQWAEPDLEQAALHMSSLLADPQHGREIGRRARLHMRGNFSHRAIGMRYRERIDTFN